MAAKMKILLGILALATIAMSKSPHPPPTPTPPPGEKLMKSTYDLTLKMLPKVARWSFGSFLFSGFLVLTGLGELALASVGQSHNEILSAIEMTNDDEVKREFGSYYGTDGKSTHTNRPFMTKMYIRSGYTFTPNYIKIMREKFASTNQNINFAKEVDAAYEINDWIRRHTNCDIRNMTSPFAITKDTLVNIVNTGEYTQRWKHPFDEQSTRHEHFYPNNAVYMMHQTDKFDHCENSALDAQILVMPYKDSINASLIVVLPNKNDGIESLIKKIDAKKLASCVVKQTDVDVALPKFVISTNTDMGDILNEINVTNIFNEGLTKQVQGYKKLYVKGITQTAYINVNEEGTEAAAASLTDINIREELQLGAGRPNIKFSAENNNHKSFIANHPFLFFFVDGGIFMFSGVYNGDGFRARPSVQGL